MVCAGAKNMTRARQPSVLTNFEPILSSFRTPFFPSPPKAILHCIHQVTQMDARIHVCPFAAGLTTQHNDRYPTNNLNQLFTSTVILRLACDCCWQIGEQRRTGNERNHVLTLKITNWKVLGPGVNSTWLPQMTEWEFSKERTYLKEFSKIWFWCHGKTLIQNNSIDCWTCPQEDRYLLS